MCLFVSHCVTAMHRKGRDENLFKKGFKEIIHFLLVDGIL